MSNYSEQEMLPSAVEIINNYPHGIDTQKLIKELRLKLKPNGEDCIVLLHRSDDKFSQKVRNLKSHKTLEKENFAIFKDNKYFITEDGIGFLNKKKNSINLGRLEILFNFIPLKYFDFPVRSRNALKNVNCEFVYDLNLLTNCGKNYKELLKIPNFGRTSVIDFEKFYINYSKYISELNLDLEINKKTLHDINQKEKRRIKNFVINHIESNKIDINHIKSESNEGLTVKASALEEILDATIKTSKISERELKIFYERILGHKTLEELGQEFGVTRERIRQQEAKLLRKIKRSLSIKDILSKISKTMKHIIFETDSEYLKKLLNFGFINGDISILSIKKLLEEFKFPESEKIQKIKRNYYIVESSNYRSHLMTSINKYFTEKTKKNGIISIALMQKDLQRRNFIISKPQLLNLISPVKRSNSLIIENEYYLPYYKGKNRSWNRLVGGIHSTLSVTNKIDVEELMDCLKRYRRIDNFSPPLKILKLICENIGYEINEDFIINNNYSENNNFLVGVRKKLFQMFTENGRIMTYEKILEEHEKYELNINSVHVMIYENLFCLPRKGIFVLAGTEVNQEKLDELDEKRKNKLKELSNETEFKFHSDGDIMIKFNKKVLLRHFIWLDPSFMNQIPQGYYKISFGNKNSEIKIFSSRMWTSKDFREFIKNSNSELVNLKINLIEKKAYINYE